MISVNTDFEEHGEDEAKGTAVVQLECEPIVPEDSPSSFSRENTTDYIKKTIENILPEGQKDKYNLYYCAGEYDYIAECKFSLLSQVFPDHGSDNHVGKFSPHNELSTQHIRQTTTRLSYQDEDIETAYIIHPKDNWQDLLCIPVEDSYETISSYDTTHIDVVEYIGKEGKTKKLFEEISNKLKLITTHPGLQKSLSLIYNDYCETLCTAIDHLWVKDYNEQFLTVLGIIDSYIYWMSNLDPRELSGKRVTIFTEQFHLLCNVLQQQVNHIAESSKLFFEVPNSSIGYTAQFDLVLHAYYGIVKKMLSQIYSINRKSWQYTLIPVINFTNTPKIKSDMFCAVGNNRDCGRLISLGNR